MLCILLLINLTVGLSWDKVIGKDVKSVDEKDIGKIKDVSQDHIQIEKGLVDKEQYSIPKSFAERYENDHVFLSLTEDEIKDKFKK
jgi:hypothetical protein